MTGTIFSQALPIVITPILTRLYSPSEFGILSIFLSITLILGSIINGRYELAIMLPNENEDAINIAALCMIICTFLSLFILFVILIIPVELSTSMNFHLLGGWIYAVPILVWCIGWFNVLNYMNSREESYKLISNSLIFKTVIGNSIQLIAPFFKAGAFGLMLGYFLSNLLGTLLLYKTTKVNWHVSLIKIKELAVRYKKFPMFSLWAILANNLSVHAINILIGLFYSVSTLGYHSLVQRVLGLPISVIGNSVGQVYYKEATKEKNNTGAARKIFALTLKKLSLLSLIVFPLVYYFLPIIFSFAFGSEWAIAGHYAQILTPLFAVRFVVSALTLTNSVFEKQGISLVWQILLLAISLFVIISSYSNNYTFESFLFIYNWTLTLHYLILLFILYKVANGKL